MSTHNDAVHLYSQPAATRILPVDAGRAFTPSHFTMMQSAGMCGQHRAYMRDSGPRRNRDPRDHCMSRSGKSDRRGPSGTDDGPGVQDYVLCCRQRRRQPSLAKDAPPPSPAPSSCCAALQEASGYAANLSAPPAPGSRHPRPQSTSCCECLDVARCPLRRLLQAPLSPRPRRRCSGWRPARH